MSRTIQQAESVGVKATHGKLQIWLPVAVFSVLWVDLVRLLSNQWETREQYAYGWFVPFFAAALLWRRWADRPAPNPQLAPRWLKVLLLIGLIGLLPLRVIYEINTDWPLISWLYALIVVGSTLYAFDLAGGWPWAKHFAFPVSFILVAVVWPYRIEKSLTQDLMQAVASITVEILGWLNIPALQRGNLIDLGTGTVGVDEACSGIRSFQSSLMAALLMGELYRIRLWPRLALVGCGIILGFCFNVVRTLLLSWQANAHGLQALEKWHDPAGITISVACFFCLWLIAVMITKWTSHRASSIQGPFSNIQNPQPSFPLRYLLAVGCWSLFCIGATEVWYRSHEIKVAGVFHWSVSFPTNNPAYKEAVMSPRARNLIASDSGGGGSWTDEDGVNWDVYFFRWKPASIASVLRARIHRPERCLPASGLEQLADGGTSYFDAEGVRLPFRQYTYAGEGKLLHVFFCQWEDGAEKQSGTWSSNQADRFRSVLVGRRKLGQQTLEVILTGPQTPEEAATSLRKHLSSLIRPEPRLTGSDPRSTASTL